ncbi:hypothetical protein N0Y54_27885 [Nostoc punctiforme UO1]|uniref:hypothetical protein n=1 Tax=Nostoc punctiforme TaxID=272131 RepID=UPI0030B361B9
MKALKWQQQTQKQQLVVGQNHSNYSPEYAAKSQKSANYLELPIGLKAILLG